MIDGRMLLIDNLMAQLNSLEGSAKIADFLAENHVRGYKGDSDSCPITNWLEDKTGLDVTTDDEVRFYSSQALSPFGDLELLKIANISESVEDFINDFDSGMYPQLEWGDIDD